MAKSKEKLQAIRLRKKGRSIKSIAKQLSVSVGSVSNWCRDVELTPGQIQILKKKAIDPFYGGRLKYIQKVKKEKARKIARLKSQGIKEIGRLSKKDMFIAGAALYWAEGFKKDSQVGFANLDPGMAKFFIKWITECCGEKRENLSLRVTVNASHRERIEEIQNYWSAYLNVPSDQFQKPYFQNVQWKKIYDNPSTYFGVIRIKVRKSTDLLRKISGWIEGLRVNAN